MNSTWYNKLRPNSFKGGCVLLRLFYLRLGKVYAKKKGQIFFCNDFHFRQLVIVGQRERSTWMLTVPEVAPLVFRADGSFNAFYL